METLPGTIRELEFISIQGKRFIVEDDGKIIVKLKLNDEVLMEMTGEEASLLADALEDAAACVETL